MLFCRKCLKIGMNISLPLHRDRCPQLKTVIHRLTVKRLQSCLEFHRYINGQNFKLLSDHQQLKRLRGEGRSIPVTVSARIQQWVLLLAGYQYTFHYKAGKRHNNADAPSRVPLPDLPHHTCQPEANATRFGTVGETSSYCYTDCMVDHQ